MLARNQMMDYDHPGACTVLVAAVLLSYSIPFLTTLIVYSGKGKLKKEIHWLYWFSYLKRRLIETEFFLSKSFNYLQMSFITVSINTCEIISGQNLWEKCISYYVHAKDRLTICIWQIFLLLGQIFMIQNHRIQQTLDAVLIGK